MRSIKRELERKRSALKIAIHSSMDSNRDTDHFRELAKDPYGSASLTHDDEIAAAVVDRRARNCNRSTPPSKTSKPDATACAAIAGKRSPRRGSGCCPSRRAAWRARQSSK